MQNYDVVIIGSGMSGLAAGIRLAQFDQKVCVLDRHSVWGGLNSFYQKDKRLFDVGLHAMTNFAKTGTKTGPLPRIARQLRIRLEEFALLEQTKSRIAFPGQELKFSNDIDLLKQSIQAEFPKEIDGFHKLCQLIADTNEGASTVAFQSAKAEIRKWIKSERLLEMILCPLLFYGSATENDMDWPQFVIMFKAIYFEGFCRPHRGVRHILNLLRNRYLKLGGELRMSTAVEKIEVDGDSAVILQLESGEAIRAAKVLSSAGLVETQELIEPKGDIQKHAGEMTFVETIFCLKKNPKDLAYDACVNFFSNSKHFKYEKPNDFVDYSSGIICSPNNFADERPLKENIVRITNIANYDLWSKLKRDTEEYLAKKDEYISRQIDLISRFIPSFLGNIEYTDSFTPLTIVKYTNHKNGAVYGSTKKFATGEFGYKNVFLCGTDQGFLGIVGAMLSGITVANAHCLR